MAGSITWTICKIGSIGVAVDVLDVSTLLWRRYTLFGCKGGDDAIIIIPRQLDVDEECTADQYTPSCCSQFNIVRVVTTSSDPRLGREL